MEDAAITERLEEIRDQLEELAEEAIQLIRMSGNKLELERAKAYWHTYLVQALKSNKWNGVKIGCPFTLTDAIEAIRPYEEDEDDDSEEDSENE